MEIIFNGKTQVFEVYGPDPVIRGGEPQPEFVSADYEKCITYRRAVEAQAWTD